MATVLETDRLLLRTWVPEDVNEVFRIYSNPEVTRFLRTPDRNLEDSRQRLQRALDHLEQHGFGFWAVVEKATARLIGSCGLKYLDGGPEIEVGYHLDQAVWGRGLATEAAAASLRYGFEHLKLERILAVVRPENGASRRVLEKIGMRYQGTGRYYDADVLVFVANRDTDLA
jgi:ribosomal-protein-alanine N-acetyltransferase